MTKEALTLALEALEEYARDFGLSDLSVKSMYVARQALAQPEQEPVAWCEQSDLDWLNSDKRGASAYVKTMLSKRKDGLAQTAIYTTPLQRKPLTDGSLINEGIKEPEQEEYLSKAYRLANELRCHLAIAPAPQRTWVGLTWSDIPNEWVGKVAFMEGAKWAAAKLNEKNT